MCVCVLSMSTVRGIFRDANAHRVCCCFWLLFLSYHFLMRLLCCNPCAPFLLLHFFHVENFLYIFCCYFAFYTFIVVVVLSCCCRFVYIILPFVYILRDSIIIAVASITTTYITTTTPTKNDNNSNTWTLTSLVYCKFTSYACLLYSLLLLCEHSCNNSFVNTEKKAAAMQSASCKDAKGFRDNHSVGVWRICESRRRMSSCMCIYVCVLVYMCVCRGLHMSMTPLSFCLLFVVAAAFLQHAMLCANVTAIVVVVSI